MEPTTSISFPGSIVCSQKLCCPYSQACASTTPPSYALADGAAGGSIEITVRIEE
jgi:hypothetical protein